MEYTSLGRTGLSVSRLCLGTMNFGPETSEADSHEIMDAALDLGINFFDTANVYGWKRGEGLTEQIIGRWLARRKGARDRIVLATKVFGRMGDGPNDRGLSAYHIKRACEASLRRMQTDHIDLYQMHHVDRDAPWEEIWQAMEQLVREGKITYVGSSNFAAWQIATANQSAAQRHFLGLVSEQSKYSLQTRHIELELAGGILGGALEKFKTGRRSGANAQTMIKRHREQLEAYEKLCADLDEPPANVALAWVLANPAVSAPIIGPRTMSQLTDATKALELTLGEGTLKQLDEIWPGPGGEAPEAYAW
jgi:aryl-alcohol dehydrogenase-like predicted oxidoreductase